MYQVLKNPLTILTVSGIALIAASTAPMAHANVENPVVKARMVLMSGVAADMKVMGNILKGKDDFDRAAVQAAIADIEERAKKVPAAFAQNEDDPKSEAKPAIWTNMDDFLAKAKAMEEAAASLKTAVASKADLPMAMQKLGGTCKACHSQYKE